MSFTLVACKLMYQLALHCQRIVRKLGNLFSRQSESRADAKAEKDGSQHSKHKDPVNDDHVDKDARDDRKKVMAASVEDEEGSDETMPTESQNQAICWENQLSVIKGMDKVTVSDDALDAATIQLTSAIGAVTMKDYAALKKAIDKLKKMDAVVVAKAVARRIKAHPWETAAIVVPLILLACTPAFLGLAGFTAGGIAAGSIAAGTQAGIGSVAAGSVFATLTSAAMAGYGVPIVFGSVWLTSSAVMWGIAAWKRWRKGDGDDEGDDELDDSAAMVLRAEIQTVGEHLKDPTKRCMGNE